MRMLRTIARQYRTMHFAVVEKPKTEEEFQARTLELSELGHAPFGILTARTSSLTRLLVPGSWKRGGPSPARPGALRSRREPPNNIPRPPTRPSGAARKSTS